MTHEEFNLLFKSPHIIPLGIGVIIGFVITIFTYWRTNPQTKGVLRITMGFLRFLGWAGVIFSLADAVLISASKKQVKPSVVILLDSSQSMMIEDDFGSRQNAVRNFLSSPDINAIKSMTTVIEYNFAESLYSGKLAGHQGKATAIGDVLSAIADSASNIDISSVVLISDGQNNWGNDPLSIAATLPFPVFCVGVGDTIPSPDIIVEQVSAPNIAYTGEILPIVAYIQSWYLSGKTVNVELREGGKIVSKQQLSLSEQGQINEIKLEHIPTEAGTRYYTIYVPPLDIEATKENNARSVAVKILSSRRKMLIVCDHPSWEVSFFRRAIETDPHMEIKLLVGRGGGDFQMNYIPTDTAQLNDFDIIVLIHAEDLLTPNAIRALRQYVLSGRSILWFSQCEFNIASSSAELLSEIMPVKITSKSRFSSVEFVPSVQSGALNNPIMEFDGDWEQILPELPPLTGINVFEINENAQVLLRNPSVGAPVLAIRQTSGGRTGMITSGPFWRWAIVPFAFGGTDKAYNSLMTNLVSYLVASERVERFALNTGKKVYKSGEPVVVTASLRDETNRPVSDGNITITVVGENDSFSLDLQPVGNGAYKTLLPSLEPGQYRISAIAKKSESILGKDFTNIIVEQFQLEFARTYQDKALLTELAKLSGGKYFLINSASGIASVIPITTRIKITTTEFQLRSSPLLLLLVTICFVVEWIMRKRANLV